MTPTTEYKRGGAYATRLLRLGHSPTRMKTDGENNLAYAEASGDPGCTPDYWRGFLAKLS